MLETGLWATPTRYSARMSWSFSSTLTQWARDGGSVEQAEMGALRDR